MKFSKILALLLICCYGAVAQQPEKQPRRSYLKFNLISPKLNIYGVNYEYKLARNVSFVLNASTRPMKQIPYGKQLDSLAKEGRVGVSTVDFKNIYVNEAHVSFLTIAPEIRVYFGRQKSKPYFGFFYQFEKINTSVPASLEVSYKNQVFLMKVPVDFDIRTSGGGIVFGKLFHLNKNFVIDVSLYTPHIGGAYRVNAKVENPFLTGLNDTEKAFLKTKIIDRFGLDTRYYDVVVNNQEASIKNAVKVPYWGYRGLNISLGYHF